MIETTVFSQKKKRGCVRKNAPPHLLLVIIPHCGHHVMLYNWSLHVAPVVCSRLSLKKEEGDKNTLIGEDSQAGSMWILLWANRWADAKG